jgi:hypothetical protein
MCLADLAKRVDAVYLRWDALVGDPVIFREAESVCDGKLKQIMVSRTRWNPYNWREDMLRMLDKVKPRLVLVPDEDEMFGKGFGQDLKRFVKSDLPQLAFRYDNPTEDGWKWYKALPYKPHVKVFKWRSGLTFIPYRKRARLHNYGPKSYMLAKSRIQHYCFYTPEIRAEKLKGKKRKMDWVKKQLRGGE